MSRWSECPKEVHFNNPAIKKSLFHLFEFLSVLSSKLIWLEQIVMVANVPFKNYSLKRPIHVK
jgi:hypothetical protein